MSFFDMAGLAHHGGGHHGGGGWGGGGGWWGGPAYQADYLVVGPSAEDLLELEELRKARAARAARAAGVSGLAGRAVFINYLNGEVSYEGLPAGARGWVLRSSATTNQLKQWLVKHQELLVRQRYYAAHPGLFRELHASRHNNRPRPPTGPMLGLGGIFGDNEADIRAKAQAEVDKLTDLVAQINDAMVGRPATDSIAKQGPTYIKALQQSATQCNPNTVAKNFLAGGALKDNAYALIDAAERTYSGVNAMFQADLSDPSGGAGAAVAQEKLTESQAALLALDDKSKFWEQGGFGSSTLDFFENIQKYAKWILIGGGLLLVAPIVLPAIGRAVSSYKSGRASGKKVAANRRRK